MTCRASIVHKYLLTKYFLWAWSYYFFLVSILLEYLPVWESDKWQRSQRRFFFFFLRWLHHTGHYNTRFSWPVERVSGRLTCTVWSLSSSTGWKQWYSGGWGYEGSPGNNRKSVCRSEGNMCRRDYHSIMTARCLAIWTRHRKSRV